LNKLRILIADDHEIVRHGLVALIKGHPDWVVCAESNNGSDAVAKAKELKPDVAILDIGMSVLNGFEATRQITRDNPQIKDSHPDPQRLGRGCADGIKRRRPRLSSEIGCGKGSDRRD
jgi:CheY-like chemotaxis protein